MLSQISSSSQNLSAVSSRLSFRFLFRERVGFGTILAGASSRQKTMSVLDDRTESEEALLSGFFRGLGPATSCSPSKAQGKGYLPTLVRNEVKRKHVPILTRNCIHYG